MKPSPNKLPVSRALTWIGASILIINSLAYLGIREYFEWRRNNSFDKRAVITAIIQTGPQKEALKTDYLTQLMGISKEHLPEVSRFDSEKAKTDLLSSPVIKEAELKIIKPGTLYVDYTVRQPVALLFDFENVAIDLDKCLFPLTPFFSPKNLPEIYLGIDPEQLKWQVPLKDEKIELAFDILKILSKPVLRDLFNAKRIDVSHAFDESYGRREIIVLMEDEIISKMYGREIEYTIPRLLRLSVKNYTVELNNYLKLREKLLESEQKKLIPPIGNETKIRLPQKVVDFRIPQLAFIDGNSPKNRK